MSLARAARTAAREIERLTTQTRQVRPSGGRAGVRPSDAVEADAIERNLRPATVAALKRKLGLRT